MKEIISLILFLKMNLNDKKQKEYFQISYKYNLVIKLWIKANDSIVFLEP